MLLKICPICKKPFMAVKEVCPSCPAHSVWNRNSRFNKGCLWLMIAFPFVAVIFFLLFFFTTLFSR